jgi:hypothetical protein
MSPATTKVSHAHRPAILITRLRELDDPIGLLGICALVALGAGAFNATLRVFASVSTGAGLAPPRLLQHGSFSLSFDPPSRGVSRLP